MASHNIDITVINTPLGVPASSDGVMMLFVHGYTAGNTLTYDTAILLSSIEQAETYGLSQLNDEANNMYVWGAINEFYDGSLNDGALLWLVLTSPTVAFSTYVTTSTFTGLVTYTAQNNPANRAKILGFIYLVPQTVNTGANYFKADVFPLIAALQAAQTSMFYNYFQWSAIVDGNNMNASITPQTVQNLPTCTTLNAPAISLCITGTQPNGVSGVGLALGRFARISVGHGFGAVADGPVTTSTAYLTNGVTIGENVISGTGGVLQVGVTYTVITAPIVYNGTTYQPGQTFTVVGGHTNFTTSNGGYAVTGGTPVGSLTQGPNGQFTTLGNLQYMFLCTQPNLSGFYWNDGATCVPTNLAESSQEYVRVANALSADAVTFFTGFKGSALPSLPSTGQLAPGWIAIQQNAFNQEYIVPLVNNGDISAATMVITGPTYAATRNIFFTLTIQLSQVLGNVIGTVTFALSV